MKLRLPVPSIKLAPSMKNTTNAATAASKKSKRCNGDDSSMIRDHLVDSQRLPSSLLNNSKPMCIDLEDVLGQNLMQPTGYRVELEDALRSNDLVALFYCGDDDGNDQSRLEALMRFEQTLNSASTATYEEYSDSDDTSRSQTGQRRLQVIICPSSKTLGSPTARTEFYRQTCRNYHLPSHWLIAIRCRHHILKYINRMPCITCASTTTTTNPESRRPNRLEQHQQTNQADQGHGHLVVVKAMTGDVFCMGGMHLITEQVQSDEEAAVGLFDAWYNKK